MSSEFPYLQKTGYRITSPETAEYNCIAWAAQDVEAWWWPDRMGIYYWPKGVPREETVEAFAMAYGLLGYIESENQKLETGFEKIAVFALDDIPTHAARQLENGKWTSKMGQSYDIEHDFLMGVNGPIYGECVLVMKRPR